MSMFARIKEIARSRRGFTMIELLIVITILGILAVAVLSAINPLEQINRGRDTATQSDAEQLLNAIERFNAFQGHFPWDASSTSTPDPSVDWTLVDQNWFVRTVGDAIVGNPDCTVIDRLGPNAASSGGSCETGSNELKPSFITRVAGLGADRGIYVYKESNDQNTDMYVCFTPQSSAFQERARQRCTDPDNQLPNDFPSAEACGTDLNPIDVEMVCLP